jgi:hypothetical protein
MIKQVSLVRPRQTSSLLNVEGGGQKAKVGGEIGTVDTTVGGQENPQAIGEISVTAQLGYWGITIGIDPEGAKEFTTMLVDQTDYMVKLIIGATQNDAKKQDQKCGNEGPPCFVQPPVK